MQCQRCGRDTEGDEYEHLGQTLCEDCYMDALSPAKSCDPWATHLAKGFEGQELTSVQDSILKRLAKGPLEPEELVRELSLNPAEFQREFSALRHMEKVRAFPKGPKRFLILFDQPNPDWADN